MSSNIFTNSVNSKRGGSELCKQLKWFCFSFLKKKIVDFYKITVIWNSSAEYCDFYLLKDQDEYS